MAKEFFLKASDYYKNENDRNIHIEIKKDENSKAEDGIDWMVSCVDSLPEKSGIMLDIGCQSGHLLERVSGKFKACYGVDIGDYSDSWQNIKNVEFLIHDIDSNPLPFPDGNFDVVTCFMVLEHVFDVFGLISEISRLVKKGGYTVIEVPNAGYIKHILSLIKGRVPRTAEQRFPFDRREGWDSQHLHYFTLKEIILLCKEFNLIAINHISRGKYKRFRRICPSLLYSSLTIVLKK